MFNSDLFKKYDVRPIRKRELVSNNLQVRVSTGVKAGGHNLATYVKEPYIAYSVHLF